MTKNNNKTKYAIRASDGSVVKTLGLQAKDTNML